MFLSLLAMAGLVIGQPRLTAVIPEPPNATNGGTSIDLTDKPTIDNTKNLVVTFKHTRPASQAHTWIGLGLLMNVNGSPFPTMTPPFPITRVNQKDGSTDWTMTWNPGMFEGQDQILRIQLFSSTFMESETYDYIVHVKNGGMKTAPAKAAPAKAGLQPGVAPVAKDARKIQPKRLYWDSGDLAAYTQVSNLAAEIRLVSQQFARKPGDKLRVEIFAKNPASVFFVPVDSNGNAVLEKYKLRVCNYVKDGNDKVLEGVPKEAGETGVKHYRMICHSLSPGDFSLVTGVLTIND